MFLKKMFLKKSLFLLVLILMSLSACDSKKETTSVTAAASISVINPRIRAMPPGQKVTAMYMQLKNLSTNNYDLVKVESNISNMIELHTHTNNDGVMQMSEVESIPIPANSMVEAKPGSYHVMIMGLKEDLKLGDSFDFSLIFKDGSRKSMNAEVKKIELK